LVELDALVRKVKRLLCLGIRMQALPELSWTSCPKLDKKFHPFSAVLRPDLPMAVDLKVARVVVANMGGEIIVTMAAEAAVEAAVEAATVEAATVEAATVEAATVEAATVEAAGADMEAVRVGIRKMKETKSQLAVLLVFFCVRCEFKYYTREIYYIVYLFRKC
jgi:hypothetical protein